VDLLFDPKMNFVLITTMDCVLGFSARRCFVNSLYTEIKTKGKSIPFQSLFRNFYNERNGYGIEDHVVKFYVKYKNK